MIHTDTDSGNWCAPRHIDSINIDTDTNYQTDTIEHMNKQKDGYRDTVGGGIFAACNYPALHV